MGSRAADIDFTFTDPITVRGALDSLARVGWSMDVSLGGLSYMIDDEDGMFEWYSSSPAGAGEVLARLDDPGNLPYSVAVDVYHPEAGTGGMLLFLPGRTEVAFVPTIDRRSVPAAPGFTDLAWYLRALVPAFVGTGLEGYEAVEIKH
ncbi:hypothetical protein ACFWM7_09720 [Streptomyces sp. NPDC058375]|uniref:hypothetical protein n=1 Tax=Streptomyces sp. NPDC058375 TaxID=3346467 RepID=UPI003668491B